MKIHIVFLFAALIGAASQAKAESTVGAPLGSAGEVLVIDADRDTITGKISGIGNVHGLAGAASKEHQMVVLSR